jgi:hypothetical protein
MNCLTMIPWESKQIPMQNAVCWIELFFLNNQPDTLIIQNLFCYKTLHVSGILSAYHQEFCTVQAWNLPLPNVQ